MTRTIRVRDGLGPLVPLGRPGDSSEENTGDADVICDTPLSLEVGGNGEDGVGVFNEVLLIVIGVIVGGYLLSGFLHPFRPCRSCGGSGVHKGSVYRRATRNCTTCGGKGRFRRVGAPAEGRAFGEARRR